MTKAIKGVWVLPATSFTEDFRFDEKAYINNLDYYLRIGVHGIIVNGSIGEFASLSDEERKRILEITIDHVNGKVPVGSCTSSCSTLQCIELTKHAKKVGATVVLVIPPYYWKPTEKDVIRHYEMISNAVDIPIMLYNGPFLSKVTLTPELVTKLVKIENVKYMKESVRDYFNIHRLLQTGIGLFAGSDVNTFPVLQLGGVGITTSPLRAKEVVEAYSAFQSGDYTAALVAEKKIMNTYVGGEETHILPWVKAACNIRGIKVGPPRPPYTPLSQSEQSDVRTLLRKHGYID